MGIAAIQAFPTNWSLGYLAIDPQARRAGVGTALVRAMLSTTAAAGVEKRHPMLFLGLGALGGIVPTVLGFGVAAWLFRWE